MHHALLEVLPHLWPLLFAKETRHGPSGVPFSVEGQLSDSAPCALLPRLAAGAPMFHVAQQVCADLAGTRPHILQRCPDHTVAMRRLCLLPLPASMYALSISSVQELHGLPRQRYFQRI